MVSLSEYLSDPCGTLSIPFWKSKEVDLPEDMRVVHKDRFSPELFTDFTDKQYFRLYHDMKAIEKPFLSLFEIVAAEHSQIDEIVTLINLSYTDLHVSREQIESYTRTPVYDPALWILVVEKDTGEIVGGGIADYDAEIHELILEWIQVLPDYRRKGIGRAIVNELLIRKQNKADFATVSGEMGNPANPEALYRKCGFTGQDYWHVLYKKRLK